MVSGTRDKSPAHRRFHHPIVFALVPPAQGVCNDDCNYNDTWQRVKLAKCLTRDGFKFELNSYFCVHESVCARHSSRWVRRILHGYDWWVSGWVEYCCCCCSCCSGLRVRLSLARADWWCELQTHRLACVLFVHYLPVSLSLSFHSCDPSVYLVFFIVFRGIDSHIIHPRILYTLCTRRHTTRTRIYRHEFYL